MAFDRTSDNNTDHVLRQLDGRLAEESSFILRSSTFGGGCVYNVVTEDIDKVIATKYCWGERDGGGLIPSFFSIFYQGGDVC